MSFHVCIPDIFPSQALVPMKTCYWHKSSDKLTNRGWVPMTNLLVWCEFPWETYQSRVSSHNKFNCQVWVPSRNLPKSDWSSQDKLPSQFWVSTTNLLANCQPPWEAYQSGVSSAMKFSTETTGWWGWTLPDDLRALMRCSADSKALLKPTGCAAIPSPWAATPLERWTSTQEMIGAEVDNKVESYYKRSLH